MFAMHCPFADAIVTEQSVSSHADDVLVFCLSAQLDIAVAWEALFAYDILIFSLTLFKTYRERSYYRPGQWQKLDLIGLIVRDGKSI